MDGTLSPVSSCLFLSCDPFLLSKPFFIVPSILNRFRRRSVIWTVKHLCTDYQLTQIIYGSSNDVDPVPVHEPLVGDLWFSGDELSCGHAVVF